MTIGVLLVLLITTALKGPNAPVDSWAGHSVITAISPALALYTTTCTLDVELGLFAEAAVMVTTRYPAAGSAAGAV